MVVTMPLRPVRMWSIRIKLRSFVGCPHNSLTWIRGDPAKALFPRCCCSSPTYTCSLNRTEKPRVDPLSAVTSTPGYYGAGSENSILRSSCELVFMDQPSEQGDADPPDP